MTPETCNSPDTEAQAVNVALDAKAFELALKAMNDTPVHLVDCDRCKGKGFHHGFGEDGCDPDWCGDCGGGGCVPAEGEETRPLKLFLQTYLAKTAAALPQDVAANEVRFQDTARNVIINTAFSDLDTIVNWRDPEAHNIRLLIWNRLDAMALEIESHALAAQSSTIASAREVIEPMLEVLQQMVANSEVDGKTYRDCHKKAVSAVRAAREWKALK